MYIWQNALSVAIVAINILGLLGYCVLLSRLIEDVIRAYRERTGK